jgi:hypothetical protein
MACLLMNCKCEPIVKNGVAEEYVKSGGAGQGINARCLRGW